MNRSLIGPLTLGFALVTPVVLSSHAHAQQDAAAKTLLQESAIAITNLKGATFKSKRSLDGATELAMGAEGSAKFMRNIAVPSASMFYALGTQTKPFSTDKAAIEGSFDGAIASWVDDAGKQIQERRTAAGDSKDARPVKTIRDQLFPTTFFEGTPFEKELKAEKIASEPGKDIAGVKCSAVRATFPATKRETVIYIADGDKLPRRIEQISALNNGKVALTLELSDLKIVELTPADLRIPDRAGYTRVAPPAPAPITPVPPPAANQPQTPPPAPVDFKPGISAGRAAPAFKLNSSAGGSIDLASMAGKPTLLCFFGSKFPASKSTLTAVQEALAGNAGVNAYAIACKEPTDAAAKAFLDSHNITLPLLLKGETIADSYKLRGYPSVVVIGADGKIKSTLETVINADEVKAALAAESK